MNHELLADEIKEELVKIVEEKGKLKTESEIPYEDKEKINKLIAELMVKAYLQGVKRGVLWDSKKI